MAVFSCHSHLIGAFFCHSERGREISPSQIRWLTGFLPLFYGPVGWGSIHHIFELLGFYSSLAGIIRAGVSDFFQFCFEGRFTLFALPALFPVKGAGFSPGSLEIEESVPVLVDGGGHALDGFFQHGFLQLAFPDDEDVPAFSLQLAPHFLVPLLISFYFGFPEVGVGFGCCVVGAVFMTVPEAAVDEDDGMILRQNYIGFPGKSFIVDAVAEAHSPQGMTELQLRLGISGTDVRHVEVSLIWSEYIRH